MSLQRRRFQAHSSENYCIPEKELAHDGYGDTWAFVTKQEFVRHNGPGFFGTWDEIVAQVSKYEGIPESCYRKPLEGATGFRPRIEDLSLLPFFMERTKETGTTYTLAYNISARDIKNAGVKSVVNLGGDSYAIDGKWVLIHGKLSYDPALAESKIASRKKELEVNRSATENLIKKSKISIFRLMDMFWCIERAFKDMFPLRMYYPGKRSWYERRLIAMNIPTSKQQSIWAIPLAARFYHAIHGDRNYRTRTWKSCVKTLVNKHMNDVAMTDDFRKFILSEARAIGCKLKTRRVLDVRKEKKFHKERPKSSGGSGQRCKKT